MRNTILRIDVNIGNVLLGAIGYILCKQLKSYMDSKKENKAGG